MYKHLDTLDTLYEARREDILQRLTEFSSLRDCDDIILFSELCFCLLTPQSKAFHCDRAVQRLVTSGLLYRGSAEEIALHLEGVRFHHTKARYVVRAREQFFSSDYSLRFALTQFSDPFLLRDFLVTNVKGFGLKEASHFLRNTGFSFSLAILDRHILKNLHYYGAIHSLPPSLSPRVYLRIEQKFIRFAETVGISLAALDLLFWSQETGTIFK